MQVFSAPFREVNAWSASWESMATGSNRPKADCCAGCPSRSVLRLRSVNETRGVSALSNAPWKVLISAIMACGY